MIQDDWTLSGEYFFHEKRAMMFDNDRREWLYANLGEMWEFDTIDWMVYFHNAEDMTQYILVWG